MSDDKKTIRVDEAAFETARGRKEQAGQTWAEYLTDENRGQPDADEVAEALTARMDFDTEAFFDAQDDAPDGVGYDDVKAACRDALREELPEGAMGR